MCVFAEETGDYTFYSFILSFLHSFILSFLHSFIPSLFHSFIIIGFRHSLGSCCSVLVYRTIRIKIDYGKCFGYRGTPQRGQVHAV